MHNELIDYKESDVDLQAYVAYDDNHQTKRPAVLIAHAWRGRDEFVNDKADYMASLGYVGFALDIYGKGVLGESVEENSALMQPFIDDRGLLLKRLNAALDTLKTLPQVDTDHIAIMGYCFGGLCALDLARSGSDISGAVSIHGLFTPPDLPKQAIKAKVLALHGHDDPMCPPEMEHALATELSEAKCDWQLHVFGNTLHAFTNPIANDPDFGVMYSKSADERSDRLIRDFFEEIF